MLVYASYEEISPIPSKETYGIIPKLVATEESQKHGNSPLSPKIWLSNQPWKHRSYLSTSFEVSRKENLLHKRDR